MGKSQPTSTNNNVNPYGLIQLNMTERLAFNRASRACAILRLSTLGNLHRRRV